MDVGENTIKIIYAVTSGDPNMGKGHRDNHKARKKRGSAAFDKKAKRRKVRKFTGSWNIEFSCGKIEIVTLAGSDDVTQIAEKQHDCKQKCEVVKRYPVKKNI